MRKTVLKKKSQDFDKAYNESRDLITQALSTCGQIYFRSDKRLNHFQALPPEEKAEVIQCMNEWAQTIIKYTAEGNYTSSTVDLVRYYSSRLHLILPRDFLEQIRDGDIVEIYKCNSKRIFFTPELFTYSSYNPDEMFSSTWWQLYTRDKDIDAEILRQATAVYSGLKTAPFYPNIPPHVVREINSELLYQAEMEFKSFSPVFLGKKIFGIASLARLRLLVN